MTTYYVEIIGLYIFTKKVIQERRSRIGNRPYLLEVSKVESTDINNPIDFEIADALYTHGLTKFGVTKKEE